MSFANELCDSGVSDLSIFSGNLSESDASDDLHPSESNASLLEEQSTQARGSDRTLSRNSSNLTELLSQTTRVFPSRAEAAKLRQTIKGLEEELEKLIKISRSLDRKLKKFSVRNAVLKCKNSSLNEQVKYFEELLTSVKENVTSFKNNTEKAVVNNVLKPKFEK